MATERGSMAADMDMYVMAADSAARSKDPEGLKKYLPFAEESAIRVNHTSFIAVTKRARGVSHQLEGDLEHAEDQLSAAADEFRKLDAPWQLGRTLFLLGETKQNQGNHESARLHYSEALAAFESLKAEPDAARARAALEALN